MTFCPGNPNLVAQVTMHTATVIALAVTLASFGSPAPVSLPSASTPTHAETRHVGSPGMKTSLRGKTIWPSRSRTLVSGSLRIPAGAQLDVGAGAIIEAAPGVTIVVERGGRLNVLGTQNEPVVLTCQNGSSTPGCWGGLDILGNAPLNHGTLTSPAGGRGGAGGCREAALEGALYGGCTADDSSGVLRYTRVQYATHGLRIFGIGSKTVLQDIQVHRSIGHGVEVVGGTAQFRHLALTTNAQYGLAYSGGWTGQAQYVVIQQDATGYAGGLLGRNAVGAGGNANATPRSAPLLANLTIITPPSAAGNPYASNAPAAVRVDRGAAGRLHNLLLIEPAIALDVDDASTCAQISTDFLRIQGLGITAPLSAQDPDADPAECSAQGESFLLFTATTVVGMAATQQLNSAIDVLLPDLRAVAGSTIATTVGVAPPAGGLIEGVTYLGAIAPAPSGGIPWYSGWTLGEQLPPPALVTLDGVVSAPGRGGVAGVLVQVAPLGQTATTDGLGRFVVTGVPNGPVEVSFVSGVPADCETPAVVRAVATGSMTHLADAVLSCAPPAPTLVAKAIVAGSFHSCGLTAAGVAYCWGVNTSGQLGDGTTAERNAPVLVSGGRAFTTLAAGTSHTCGITSAGSAYCWGSNSFAEIGDGTSTNRTTPTAVGGGFAFAALAGGESHTCGVTTTALAYCWGRNLEGQLGLGTSTQNETAPRAVIGGQVFSAVVAGQLHTCGLTPAGAAFCWGRNAFGQLGDGTTSVRLLPTAVTGGRTFATLTAGTNSTCGVTSAGVALCWGGNTFGELGDGSTARRTSPTLVSGGRTFSTLVMRGQHTCALTGVGTGYCWGRNIEGQLGAGTVSVLPTTVPTRVSGSQSFIALATGETHTCALTATGSGACWGSNLNGQLGDAGSQRAAPTLISGPQTLASVTAGQQHSCGLTSAGSAFCWGTNGNGQLGDGTQVERTAPTAVSGGIAFASLRAGGTHTCGLTGAGAAWCWRSNSFGQLGDGTTTTRLDPTPVSGGTTFIALESGGSHTCGLTATGAAYCWGLNSNGQLGDGSTTSRTGPTLVSGGLAFTAIALSRAPGSAHTCAQTAAGAAYCWGPNQSGQLGDGTATGRTVPTAVVGGQVFAALAVGSTHTCARTGSGAAFCWGANAAGQIGDGSIANRLAPTAVSGSLYFASLTANTQSCGITSDGVAYCWGSNSTAQLGDGTTLNRSAPALVSGGLVFSELATGQGHTCGRTNTAASYCWGNDRQSQLGLGLPAIRTVAGGIVFRVK